MPRSRPAGTERLGKGCAAEKVRFGKMPLQRTQSDGQAFKPAQLLVAHKVFLDDHSLLK
jgi:hypothetical protein